MTYSEGAAFYRKQAEEGKTIPFSIEFSLSGLSVREKIDFLKGFLSESRRNGMTDDVSRALLVIIEDLAERNEDD